MSKIVDILNKSAASNIEEVIKPDGLYRVNVELNNSFKKDKTIEPDKKLHVTKTVTDRAINNVTSIPKVLEGSVKKLGDLLKSSVENNVRETLKNVSDLTSLPNRVIDETARKIFDLGNDYIKKAFDVPNKAINKTNQVVYNAITKRVNKVLGKDSPKSFDSIINNVNNNKSASTEFEVASNQSSLNPTETEKRIHSNISDKIGIQSKDIVFDPSYSEVNSKLPFRGYSDIANLEARVDYFYDIAINTPNHLKKLGLPDAVSNNSKKSPLSNQLDVTLVTTSNFSQSESFQMGKMSELLTNRVDFIASIDTDIVEDIDLSVRTWLIKYQNYRFQNASQTGYNLPNPNIILPPYLSYYYLTFYYLSYDKTEILFERTFYGVPVFSLDLTPRSGVIKRYNVKWDIIGEEPSLLFNEKSIYLGVSV